MEWYSLRRLAPRPASCMRSTRRPGANCGTAAMRSLVRFAAVEFRWGTARSILPLGTEHFMHLDFRSSINVGLRLTLAGIVFASAAWGQMPDGPGRDETIRVCGQCHELERSLSLRQDRDGWQATMTKMAGLGMKATEKDLAAVFEYLTTNFPGTPLPRLNVNQAAAIDFEARFSLKRSEAAQITAYRAKNGAFKSIEDLKKVPGIDIST